MLKGRNDVGCRVLLQSLARAAGVLKKVDAAKLGDHAKWGTNYTPLGT
jgi:hypothetical protein